MALPRLLCELPLQRVHHPSITGSTFGPLSSASSIDFFMPEVFVLAVFDGRRDLEDVLLERLVRSRER
jgi:hypothetical protein